MIREVLVPLDGSARSAAALDPAWTIARHLGCEVRVASFHRGDRPPDLVANVVDQMRALGTKRTRLIIEPVVSTVAARIAGLVDDARNPLVCMASHGRGRSAGVVGSVAAEVMQLVGQPVLLVGPAYRPGGFRPGGTLVVADPGHGHELEIVPAAERFARLFDCPVEVETAARPGEAARLVRHLQAVDASAVAIATRNRQGWDRLIHGSTAAAVLRGAPCPVLAIDTSSSDV